jgi:hypothetical protein
MRPVAYYTLAVHDPKHRDVAEICRMLSFHIERVLTEDGLQKGITIVWDTRNTGLKNTDNEFLREFLQFFRAQVRERERERERDERIVGWVVLSSLAHNFSSIDRVHTRFHHKKYPEVMAQMLVAPTGMLQRSVWGVASRFLDERRAARIKLLPDMEGLLQFIDPAELLATHGGLNPWVFDPEQV